MTAEEFTAFYPQFAGFTPAEVPAEYIRQANARFTRRSSDLQLVLPVWLALSIGGSISKEC